jgi:hypothetical protein
MHRNRDLPFTVLWILSHVLTGLVSGAGFLYLIFCLAYRYIYPGEIPGSTYEWQTADFAAWGALCLGAIAGATFGLITALTDLKTMRSVSSEQPGGVHSMKYVR